MNKTSVIAVGLIFLVSILVVGFFGIRYKVNDPEVYVEKIEWNSSQYENDKNFSVKKYTKEEKEENKLSYDAELKHVVFKKLEDYRLNFKFTVLPYNASDTLDYSINVTNFDVRKENKDDKTVDVVFNEATSVNLTASSTDGRTVSYTIKITIIVI